MQKIASRFLWTGAIVAPALLLLTLTGCDPKPADTPVAESSPVAATTPAAEESPASSVSGPPAPPGPKTPGDFDKKPFKGNGKIVKLPSGLQYEDMTIGKGATAVDGKTCVMHYTGTLKDGTKFDSSRDRGQPFDFPLGAGRVIKGWDEGVAGMKVGGRRKLIIPGDLGYGAQGTPDGTIPPNATLIFDVELMDVQ